MQNQTFSKNCTLKIEMKKNKNLKTGNRILWKSIDLPLKMTLYSRKGILWQKILLYFNRATSNR